MIAVAGACGKNRELPWEMTEVSSDTGLKLQAANGKVQALEKEIANNPRLQ
ncbi:hypothetical protein L195_g046965, partial [Trifolium pratense]